MTINFYDVEHGNCTHIITPNNKHILVDIGSKSDYSLSNYIKNKYFKPNGGNIDCLIITHPHEDHIFDLPQLNSLLEPRILYRPKRAFKISPTINTQLHKEIASCANSMNDNYNSPIASVANPLLSLNNGGVDIEIIPALDYMTSKDDLNSFSALVIVKYLGHKFVLSGDNPKAVLENMIEVNYCSIKDKISNATALLAPHHGRTGEFNDSFFKLVNPCLTIISDKSIVHSTQEETAKLYKGRGAKLFGRDRYVLTTRRDGTISFTVNSGSCSVSMDQGGY